MRLREFLIEEDGMGTAEVVIIAAVLVAVALIFRTQVTEFVEGMLKKGLDHEKIVIENSAN